MEEQRDEINDLQQKLNQRDEQLQQAQSAAQQAQAAAQQAQAAADQQQQSLNSNAQAVSSLQSSVADLKASNEQTVATVKRQTKMMKKAVLHPDEIHYKGITISPHGSFLAAETVWRQGATGGGLNTAFTGIPLDNAPDANISEFDGTGRQSRIALKATGKAGSMRMTGYYEMDWLGTGITSNNNQSNSYVVRMRQLWAQAALDNGWTFTGGQMWSLTTETTDGLENLSEVLPATIDPQYTAGFVWNRQYGFRVTKKVGSKLWFGASAEEDQMLLAGNNLPKNELVGSAGNGGGLYNSTANYSFNLSPEIVAKMAVQPGWGHWELFGVARFFHDRVYPTGSSPYNDSTVGGGVGASVRGPLFNKKISIGLKGLYGDGTGRMGWK
jgi:type II secretory pathway pseudopilin PulG